MEEESQFDLGSYGITQEDVYKTMFPAPNLSYSNNPKVELRMMIAKERAAKEEEGRQISAATLPFIQQDIVASQKNQVDIKSKIDQALNVLNQPAPEQTNQFNEAEMYAGAIGGLLSGGQNLPDLLNALSKVSGARNKMEFDNKLRQYGLTRETAGAALQQFADRLKDEQVNERYMLEQNRKAEGEQAAQRVRDNTAGAELASKLFNAESEQEVRFYAKLLRENYPDKAPTPEAEEAQVAGLRNKAKALGNKDARTDLEGIITSFNTDFQKARTDYGGMLPDKVSIDLKARGAAIRKMAESSFPDLLPSISTVSSSKTAGQTDKELDNNFRQKQFDYQKDQDKQKREDKQADDRESAQRWKVEAAGKGIIKLNPDGSYKVIPGAAKNNDLDTELADAKNAVAGKRLMFQNLQLDPMPGKTQEEKDAIESKINVQNTNDLRQLVIAEWQAFKNKAVANGQKAPVFSEYVAKAYPDLAASWWGIFIGAKVREERAKLNGPINRNQPTPSAPKVKPPAGFSIK